MAEEIGKAISDYETIKYTLRPIVYFSWLLGVGIARPRDWPKVTTFIRFIHFLVCFVVMGYGVYDYTTIQEHLKDPMYKLMYFMNKAFSTITSFYYLLFGVWNYKKWPCLMNKIMKIDEKIRREDMVENRPIKIKLISIMVLIFILGPVSLASHVVYYYYTQPEIILVSDLLHYYTVTQFLTANFVFNIIVYIVFHRIRLFNKLVKHIGIHFAAPWIICKLQYLKELHHEICDLVFDINSIYGIQLLFTSINSFITVVTLLYRVYGTVAEQKSDFIMSNNAIWLIYGLQFALICIICSMTCRESQKTGTLIHQFALEYRRFMNKDPRGSNKAGNRRSLNYFDAKTYEGVCVQDEITHFSVQLMQHKIAFNAYDFFEMNNILLQSFVGVITTYLIILIQLKKQPETDNATALISTLSSMGNTTNGIMEHV